ncbi:MAG: beta-propeller domain-containing protein, partial [Gammaproteobacteria bacterium]
PESQAPTIRVMAVDADPASASEVGRITLDDNNTTIQGLYLAEKINNEQLLSVVSSENYYHIYYDDVIFEAPVEAPFIETDGGEASSSETSSAGSGVAVSRAEGAAVLQDYHQNRTILSTYRVNNPAQVTEAWKLAIEGQYISSRVVNNTLFVVTSFYPMDEVPPLMATFDQASDVPIEALLPDQVYNDAEVDKLISENDCFVPDTYDSSNKYAQLVTITAVPLADPDARASACMLGNSYELYASTESMYLIEQHYPENFDIHKFAISDGFPVYHASTSLSGHVGFNNPAFRLSESGDYLRVVHTEQSDGERRFAHRLTILKEANDGAARFDVVADIPNSNRPSAIGKPNEDIYAVRYVGDMAYVVTFQRTDPLYAINLTSPEDPFIAGSVEIPGFADYLHPIGSNLLLGVGRQASDEGRQQGIKVSLFDVSNPAAPREVDRQVYGNQYSNSPLEYDAKALSELFHVDTQTHRITIPMSVTGAQQGENTSDEFKADYHWLYDGLELLEVNSEAKTLTAVGTLKSYSSENEAERRWGHIQRGLLMGESVHFVYGNHVWSSQWNNPISSTGAQ